MDATQLIESLITGLVSGVVASLIVWFFTYKYSGTKVIYAQQIIQSEGVDDRGRDRYRIRIQNIGRRDVVDAHIEAKLVVQGLKHNSKNRLTYCYPSIGEDGRIPIFYAAHHFDPSIGEKSSGTATFTISMENVLNEYQKTYYAQSIREKAGAGSLTLKDVLGVDYECKDRWIQFFIFGYDKFTGRHVVFSSKNYRLNDIVCGTYIRNTLEVAHREGSL